MITVSLQNILDRNPCKEGFLYALFARGKITEDFRDELLDDNEIDYASELPEEVLSMADDEQFPAASLVIHKDLDYAIWGMTAFPEYNNLWRKYSVWCAQQVKPWMNDKRSIAAVDIASRHVDKLATDKQLAEAHKSATDAVYDEASQVTPLWDDGRVNLCLFASRMAVYVSIKTWLTDVPPSPSLRYAYAEKLIQILNAGEWVD